MKGYGEVWVLATDWSVTAIQMHDDGFTLTDASRIYFGSQPDDVFTPFSFWQTPLMNKHFSFTVDLSNVGCECNAAAYFVDMPASGVGDGDYYCDAVIGSNYNNWCPMYHLMEGNKYTMATTLHTCEKSAGGGWDTCDIFGCQVNAYNVDPEMMCPEDRCTINTKMPFNVSYFQNGTQVTATLEQDGNRASFAMCNQGEYVNDMAPAFDGMVFTAMLWGGAGIDMSWLDGMTGCEGECGMYDGVVSVSFSNFELKESA